jgi:hypothetical protein
LAGNSYGVNERDWEGAREWRERAIEQAQQERRKKIIEEINKT